MENDSEWFSRRTSRLLQCPKCRGRGQVIESYSLVDAGDLPVDGAPANAIRALVCGSSSIFDCIQEAADIAARSRRPVAFTFTSGVVVINPGDDGTARARQWWVDTYGETPEESASRR